MARPKRGRHSVRGSLHVRELSKAGSSLTLELFVRERKRRVKIGELVIGRGALYWYAATDNGASGSAGPDFPK